MDKSTWYMIIGAWLFIMVIAGVLILSYWDKLFEFLRELWKWLSQNKYGEK